MAQLRLTPLAQVLVNEHQTLLSGMRKMGLFTKWKLSRYLRIQEREISSFTAQLSQMDGDEIGLVVALATDTRNRLEDAGFLLSDPIVAYTVCPDTPSALNDDTNTSGRRAPSGSCSGDGLAAHVPSRCSVRAAPLGETNVGAA
jgi:hypothetical protein